MNEVGTDQLKDAVERTHGGTAHYVESVQVKEEFDGNVVWEGVVSVFDLTGNPTAKVAYAWSAPVEGSGSRRFYAVLGAPPIDSAQDSVRAAIVQEFRESQTDS